MLTLPVIGAITWTGFEHRWLFLFALVPLALLVLYVAAQIAETTAGRRDSSAPHHGQSPRRCAGVTSRSA